jgi:uncharacterized protein YndB with AHSA1/START domain
MTLGTIFLDGDLRGVRFERDFDATPEEVWRAIATPEGIAGWLARPVRWELEPGTPWEVAFDGDSGRGTVVAVEPGRSIELTWQTGGETESVVRIQVDAAAGGSRLVLEHTRLDPESAPGYGAGWQAHLEALELAVAGVDAGVTHDWWERYQALRPEYDAHANTL